MPGISVVPLSAIVRAPAGTVVDAAGTGRLDALAAHHHDPSGAHRLAVEHAIGLQDNDCGAGCCAEAAAGSASNAEGEECESS